MSSLPEKLYKYQSFNTISISNLKKQQIFFSDPNQFNDPYDCALEFDAENLREEHYKTLMKEYLEENFDSEILDEIKEKHGERYELDQNFVDSIDSGISKTVNELKENILSRKGVACFSKDKNDILMWAYYADGHKGFCLEFDTSFEPFNKAHEVKYKDSIPQLKISEILWGNDEEYMFEPLITKYTTWKHEDEYRVIHNEKSQPYTYPAKSLTGVYFGSEMKKEHIEIIALILRGQNPNVQLYQGKRRADEFKIDFQAVEYTPYVEIEKKQDG